MGMIIEENILLEKEKKRIHTQTILDRAKANLNIQGSFFCRSMNFSNIICYLNSGWCFVSKISHFVTSAT
jgi:hypothetical protein